MYFFSDIWFLFGQLDLFILQWEKVLCSGFDLTVLDPSDRRGTDTYVSLLLRIKRWGLSLHRWNFSTSCHRSYCITLFPHELNTLDACWIEVDVWSNSSRCRQEFATSWALCWFSLEEERVKHQSSVSISLSFWEPRYQSSRRLHASHLVPTQTNKNLATNEIEGLSIPSRPLAKVRSDRDNKINIFGIFMI